MALIDKLRVVGTDDSVDLRAALWANKLSEWFFINPPLFDFVQGPSFLPLSAHNAESGEKKAH
jgi:hypothetical protein